MTRLAKLIGLQEGFFRSGSLPARNHNPGDLRHSPHSSHPGESNAIGVIQTDEAGWADLERQLVLDSQRLVIHDPVTNAPVIPRLMTLRDAIYSWAPPIENDSAAYLEFVVNGFGGVVDADTPLAQVIQIQA